MRYGMDDGYGVDRYGWEASVMTRYLEALM